jgi:hypothetical protein
MLQICATPSTDAGVDFIIWADPEEVQCLTSLFSLAQDLWDFRNTAKISLHSSVCGASERSPDSASNSLDQLKRIFLSDTSLPRAHPSHRHSLLVNEEWLWRSHTPPEWEPSDDRVSRIHPIQRWIFHLFHEVPFHYIHILSPPRDHTSPLTTQS